MTNRSFWIAILALSLCAGCAEPPIALPDAEAAFAATEAAAEAAHSDADRALQWEGFLQSYPQSEFTVKAAREILRLREGGNMAAAIATVAHAVEVVEEPETAFRLTMLLAPATHEAGQNLDLSKAVADLEAVRPLKYWEHWEAGQTALDQENWKFARGQLSGALDLASPEAYRSEFPDREITDEKAERRGKRRKVWALPLRGWALANLGLHEEAEQDFSMADGLAERNFIGLTDAGLDSYHGRAALLADDPQRAVELLGLPAVMGGDEHAMEALTASLREIHGDAIDVDRWARDMRPKLARQSADFELLDYTSTSVDFSQLKKGRVTLLAFWFPT